MSAESDAPVRTAAIVLDHTIVPARDRVMGAAFFAGLMGLPVEAPTGPFVPVRVNSELTFDFDERGRVEPGHYGFLVDDPTFDAALRWLARRPGVEFGSGPENGWDRDINRLGGGRGVYVRSPEGHSYELFTVAC
ncbi:VOC family protein [Nocardia sp. NPDC003963]